MALPAKSSYEILVPEQNVGHQFESASPSSNYQRNLANVLDLPDRAIYSHSTEDFKRPKNREDSFDLDDNLTESIAAQKTFI